MSIYIGLVVAVVLWGWMTWLKWRILKGKKDRVKKVEAILEADLRRDPNLIRIRQKLEEDEKIAQEGGKTLVELIEERQKEENSGGCKKRKFDPELFEDTATRLLKLKKEQASQEDTNKDK